MCCLPNAVAFASFSLGSNGRTVANVAFALKELVTRHFTSRLWKISMFLHGGHCYTLYVSLYAIRVRETEGSFRVV